MSASGARRIRGGGLWVSLVTLTVLLATGPRLAIVWDEGYTLGRVERVRSWLRAMVDPPSFAASWRPPVLELVPDGLRPPTSDEVDTRADLLTPRVLAWFWPFAREEPHGHPPFYALVALIGDVLTPWREPLPRARLGTMLAFSLTAGALYAFLARRRGPWPGLLAAAAWGLQPHLFALGHYATYDALLACLWVGALLAFARAVEPGRRAGPWAVVFGLLLGAAMGTKLTGWLLPVPMIAWTVLYRNSRGLFALLLGGLVALVVVYALTPPWWPDPIAGVRTFFASNLSRGRHMRITTMFLGHVYETPTGSLPWYNTLLWTVFVTPVGFLLLALAGTVRALQRCKSEPFGTLVLIHWVFLLTLRALPHTPGHDGVRQFLPAFGCLALMTGLGAASAVERMGRWAKPVLAATLAEALLSVAVMMPVPLSYYSPLIGGLPGAAKLGMEPTYYWDALTDDPLNWLNTHTPPGRKVAFATTPTSFLYLRRTKQLRPGFIEWEPGTYAWYVIQNRPGNFLPMEGQMVAAAKPAYVFRKLGVPLLWIYPYDYVRIWEQFQRQRGTSP